MTKRTHTAKQNQRIYTPSVKMQTTCTKSTHHSPNEIRPAGALVCSTVRMH